MEFKVELTKQLLIKESEEFNTIDAFRILDNEGKGFIHPYELMKGLI